MIGVRKNLGRMTMHRFTISAAATVFVALLAFAPAQADTLQGASPKNGNQCFNFSPTNGARDSRWGYWSSCPQAASAAVAPSRRHIRRQGSATR